MARLNSKKTVKKISIEKYEGESRTAVLL